MKRWILAVESSCDETAIALVSEDGEIADQRLLSQIDKHQAFGGVVPELASRWHFECLQELARPLLEKLKDRERYPLIAIAATQGPGLMGPLLVGSSFAQGLATGWGLEFRGVHHLRGHLASVLLSNESSESLAQKAQKLFPSLVVLASGGHTQVLEVNTDLSARKILDTADDAAGECFDKSAKLMGLPYPGGPAIEALAAKLQVQDLGRAKTLSDSLPRPRSEAGFSFSGLKTAIRLKLEKNPELKSDAAFAWAIQKTITDTILIGLKRALSDLHHPLNKLAFCGGVAANLYLRSELEKFAKQNSLTLHVPPLKFCTDNAVMIAAAAWVQSPALELKEVVARLSLSEGPRT